MWTLKIENPSFFFFFLCGWTTYFHWREEIKELKQGIIPISTNKAKKKKEKGMEEMEIIPTLLHQKAQFPSSSVKVVGKIISVFDWFGLC